MSYRCDRCGYTNNLKTNFIRHLQRKYTCKPILSDIGVNEIYNKYFKNGNNKLNKIISQNIAKNCQYSKFVSQNIAKISQKTSPKYKCSFCNRKFKHLSSKYKHEKDRCKDRKDSDNYEDLKKLVNLLNEQLKEQRQEFNSVIEKKDKQIEELIKKTGVNIGTQNIHQNIQNNIKILAYNKTDLTHLTDNDFMYCLKRSNFCIPNLVKKIHFDPKKPENHNIYISNIKNNYVMIYDGNKWNLHNRNEIIDDIINDKECILEDKLEDWLEKGKEFPDIMKKFNRYIEKKENDIVLNKIKQEIKLLLFNNRKMILKNE